MVDFSINVRSNAKQVMANLSSFASKQFPFAMAVALTDLAKDVQAAEKASLHTTFDRPTPFTVNSIRVIPAKKNLWISTVFVMDIAAQYLYPYEVGGMHKLIGPLEKTWLNPKDYSMLNQYGNFPVNTLERLIGSAKMDARNAKTKGYQSRAMRGLKPFPGKPGIFVGTVTTKGGQEIGGVWKRIDKNTGKGSKNGRGLKLIIRFGDARPVRQHLNFVRRAIIIVDSKFNQRFGAALAKAIATAKP
jgi:hypothetical protein